MVYVSIYTCRHYTFSEDCSVAILFASLIRDLSLTGGYQYGEVVALMKTGSTFHDRHGARLGLHVKRLIARKVPLPSLKCMPASVFKKTRALFSNSSSILIILLFILLQPQVGL